jgi:hypothetical protein
MRERRWRTFSASCQSKIKFSLQVPIRTSRLIYGDYYDDATTLPHASPSRLPCEYPKRYQRRRRSVARPLTCRLQDAQQHRAECGNLPRPANCRCAGTNPRGRRSLGGWLVPRRKLWSGISSVQSGRSRTSHRSCPGSTTDRDTCPSCSRDSDPERRRPIIVFASKPLAVPDRPHFVKRTSLFARDLRKKRGGSETSSSRVAPVAHALLVSLTFLQTQRRSTHKDRPPRFERKAPP